MSQWKLTTGFSWLILTFSASLIKVGYRTAATSKMEHFVIILNGFQLLTLITKRSILNVAAVLDPPLLRSHHREKKL